MTDYGRQLRRRLDRDEILVAPGVHDPISARVVEETGDYDAVKLTGSGTVFSRTGLPDAGLATMTEMVEHARRVQQSVDLPVIADADSGYGDVTNVMRTVREFADAGVAGIHIEDQSFPKRNADVTGVQALPLDAARRKIRAAVDTRDECDSEMLIIGRTDVRRTADGTLDDAIERAAAFFDEGADVVFLKVPESPAEAERAATAVDGPLMYPCSGTAARLDPAELEAYGWAIAFYGRMLIHPIVTAMHDTLARFEEEGVAAVEDDEERFHEHYESVHHLAGIESVTETEREHLDDESLERYEGSTGHDV